MAAEQHVQVSDEETEEKTPKTKVKRSILDSFNKLTNGDEKVRVRSGVDLLKHLSEKDGDELKYALGRLIRGLGSPKAQARSGFFAALVALLNLKNVTVHEIFEHVTKELHKGGGNSKSENADICMGQILVSGAILRCGLYETSSPEDKIKVVELLINAGKARTYLNLAAYTFLLDVFPKIDSKEFQRVILPLIKEEAFKPWADQNLDSLFLVMQAQTHFPNIITEKFLKSTLGTSQILATESLNSLCNTLTTIPRATSLNHPIYAEISKQLGESTIIVEFFNELDQTLQRSNRNRYMAIANLILGTLGNLKDTSLVPDLLTTNFIQQTINTYKTAVGKARDREFQQLTQKVFDVLVETLKKDDVKTKTKIKVIKRLLFYPGTFIFEKVTRSRIVQLITGTLSSEGVKKLAEVYKGVVLGTADRVVSADKTVKWWNNDRIYASHLLVKLLNHTSMHDLNDWKTEQITFVMKLGLLNNPEVGHELADAYKQTFFTSLDLKLRKLEDLRAILNKVVQELDELLPTFEDSSTALRNPLQEEEFQTWKRTLELATKISESSKKKKAVFHTLFLHLGLQLFNTSAKLAVDSLKELFSCYDRVNSKKNTENSEDPLWIEVVVDLFLNLLSHNSHLLRNVIGCVFPHLCKYMNATAMHQVLAVLDPKNEDNPLSMREESDDDDDEESDGEEAASSESEVSEDDEGDEPVNDRLRLALQQALGAGLSDTESVDLDRIDPEEGDKLDLALGQAFKQFKPNLGRKKKQSRDDEVLTHFRVRVLDLVEIYLNSNPSMLLTLEIMLPLLQTLEFSIRDEHQRPLQDRVRACLKKLSALKKFEDVEGVSEQILVDLLRSLLEKGTKNAIIIQDMGEKIAECCIFTINCSRILGESPKKKKNTVKVVIRENLETFFGKRDCLIPYVLFKNVLQLNWEGILKLIPILSTYVFTDAIRPFRRNQAIELLRIFYQNHPFISTHAEEIGQIDEIGNFLRDCIGFLRDFNTNTQEKKVRDKFVASLFQLLSAMKLAKVDFDSWSVIAEGARELRSRVTCSNDSKAAFRKLCKSLGVSNVVAMKTSLVKLNNNEEKAQNGDVEMEEEEKGKKKEKKRKRVDNEAMKLKKESKRLRLEIN